MEIIELLPRLHLLRFPVGGGAQVAGHADGSIGLYLPEPRVLFTGDTVARCSSRPAMGGGWPWPWP